METQILQIINGMQPILWVMLFKLAIAFVIFLLLKNILESITSYVLFLMNKRLSIGVKVKIKSEEGIIINYDIRWIFIKTTDGSEIIIPMKRWQYYDWKLRDTYKDLYGGVDETKEVFNK
jgi:small-conductance mechanosensitive channel